MAQKVLKTSSDYTIQSGGNITLTSTPGGDITIDTGAAGTTYVTGNLTVQGTTTTVDSTIVTIEDNTIILNSGESGAGVTLDISGVEIDRGTLPNSAVYWRESTNRWELYADVDINGFAAVKASSVTLDYGTTADTIDNDTTMMGDSISSLPTQHAVKTYVDTSIAASANTIFEGNSSVTVHDAGVGYVETIIDGTVISQTSGTGIVVNTLSSLTTNGNLTITADGTGEIVLDKTLAMPYQGAPPSAAGFTNKFYADTPGSGGSGLYFVNTTSSDELVSKTKAIVYGIIF